MIIKQKKKKNLGIHQLTLFNIISCLNNLIILQKSFCYLLHIDKHLVIRIEVFCSQDSIGKLFTMSKTCKHARKSLQIHLWQKFQITKTCLPDLLNKIQISVTFITLF